MSVDGWNSVLVLGGIRSGKSEFAESLLADAPAVRYVATGAPADADDPDWAARLARSPPPPPPPPAAPAPGAPPPRARRPGLAPPPGRTSRPQAGRLDNRG